MAAMPFFHRLALLCLLILGGASLGRCATQNHFVVPPAPAPSATNPLASDQTYKVGQLVHLQWLTNYSSISLHLAQFNNSTTVELLPAQGKRELFPWTVEPSGFDLGENDVFYLQLRAEGGTSDSFRSHSFNITTNSTSSHHSSSGLSRGAQIGIGVGVGIAGALLVGTGLFLFWRRIYESRRAHHRDPTLLEKNAWQQQQQQQQQQHSATFPPQDPALGPNGGVLVDQYANSDDAPARVELSSTPSTAADTSPQSSSTPVLKTADVHPSGDTALVEAPGEANAVHELAGNPAGREVGPEEGTR